MLKHIYLLPALAWLIGSAAPGAGAQNYPTRPVRLIVPQAPGSSSDTLARIVAIELTKQLGQQVVVDNRPGGALTIGMDLTAKAAPDGYTLGYAPVGALAIGPHMVRKLPYDVLKDFQPVAQTASNYMLLAAAPSSPLTSVRDVIDYAKQHPGKLSYASSGNGTPGQVGMELFKSMTGTQIMHIPFKDASEALAALLGGQTDLMFASLSSSIPLIKSGKLKAFAVTGDHRSPSIPELPTVAEAALYTALRLQPFVTSSPGTGQLASQSQQ